MQQVEFESDSYANLDLDFRKLHETVFPADVRDGDNVHAMYRLVGETEFSKAKIWRISPLGIEILVRRNDGIAKGDSVDLTLLIGGQRTNFKGLIVEDDLPHDDHVRIGVRFVQKSTASNNATEKRKSTRWNCSGQYHPTAVSVNPVKFNDYLYFKIRDISPEGMQLLTSLRNKFIVPGMSFELQASFPSIGQTQIPVSVSRIGFTLDNGKDYLSIGVSFQSLEKSSRSIIAQYLLQFAEGVSLKKLREGNFLPKSVGSAVNYSFVSSDSTYKEVLNLRLAAYKKAGKIEQDITADKLSDLFDARSRILTGTIDGKLVSTARVTFAEQGQKFEIEKVVDWPADFPSRETTVEVSKACTHPSFRGSDLFLSLVREIAIVCIQSRRDWVIIGSTPELLKTYKSIGFSDTGVRYEHPDYQNMIHHVLIGNLPSMMKGVSVGPIEWNVIWKDTYQFLDRSNILRFDGLSAARIYVYRMLSPLAWIASNRSRKPRTERKATK
ncbi:MAG: PilZ domain-containing protein [Pseudomonadota bacterium]